MKIFYKTNTSLKLDFGPINDIFQSKRGGQMFFSHM